jgi:hypothetical protein
MEFDICKSSYIFYKDLLWSYLNDLELINPDRLREVLVSLKEGQE